MSQEDFIKLLEQEGIDFETTGSGITVTGGSAVILRVTNLPTGIKFENGGSVYLNKLTKLPKGAEFKNGGSAYLNRLTELPEDTKFENGGGVFLDILAELPKGIKFNNDGGLTLNNLIGLPNGTEFKNGGYVSLNSLTELPENIKFENGGTVFLPNLKGNQPYRGKELKFRTLDGFTTIICETKKSNGYKIHSARYFGGGAIEELKRCYIAEGEGFTAHGATIKEALEDLRYKLAEDQDKSSVVADVMSSGRVTLAQFRALTGACREGIRNHLKSRGIDLGSIDDMALPEALGLMEGTPFGEEFKRQIA